MKSTFNISRLFGKKQESKSEVVTHKWCNYCKQYLPLSDFNKSNYYVNGHACYCKSCLAKYRQARKHVKTTELKFVKNTQNMEMHQIIKERRLDMGLSQKQVAEKANLTFQTVLSIEKGRSATIDSLKAILKALDLKIQLVDCNENN